MIRFTLGRINFIIKSVIIYILLLACVVGLFYLFLTSYQSMFLGESGAFVSIQSLLMILPIYYYAIAFFLFSLIYIILIYNVRIFYTKVESLIIASLSERKLPEDFPLFKSNATLRGILSHLNSVLSLYKSFDNMKTARILLEVNAIKQLMNVIDEGVLLINAERVVTHINHIGEQLLRFIPGEVIGEAISRKISNESFLSHLDQVLEFDQKVIGKTITFGDTNHLLISMYPVKDKFGDVVRSLVVIRKAPVISSVKPSSPDRQQPANPTPPDIDPIPDTMQDEPDSQTH